MVYYAHAAGMPFAPIPVQIGHISGDPVQIGRFSPPRTNVFVWLSVSKSAQAARGAQRFFALRFVTVCH
jgi:hypothetical protein